MFKILVLLFSLFTTTVFTGLEAVNLTNIVNTGAITDKSDIDNDLKLLDINPEDYKIYPPTEQNVKWKNDTYITAIGENRISQNKIDVYFYTYYPIEKKKEEHHSLSFDLKINNINHKLYFNDGDGYTQNGATELKYISEANENTISKNITKFKFTLLYASNDKRNYFIESIYNNFNKKKSELSFEATCKEVYGSGQVATEINFNSFIFITDDEFQVASLPASKVHNLDGSIKGFFEQLGSLIVPEFKTYRFFLYHFNSPRKIDEILEVEFVSDYYTYKKYDNWYSWLVHKKGEGKINEKFNEKRVVKAGVQDYTVKGETLKLDRFATPASKRWEELKNTSPGTQYIESSNSHASSMSDFFNKYQHSLLLNVGKGNSFFSIGGTIEYPYPQLNEETWDMMENVQLKRMKFKCDGKVYNAYVADDPDDIVGEIGIIPPKDFPMFPQILNFFNGIGAWFSKNWIMLLSIIGGILILIPLIYIFGFKFITSTLKCILKCLIKLFELLYLILKSPFLLINKICGNIKKRKKEKQEINQQLNILQLINGTSRNQEIIENEIIEDEEEFLDDVREGELLFN